jgi:PIN domain nuclease of toxin-antitoxin system
VNTTAVVVDTHAIVWYLSEPERLSTPALQTLDDIVEAGGILYIASITVVELCYLVERGRLPESRLLGLDALLSGRESALMLAPLDDGVVRAVRQIPRDVVRTCRIESLPLQVCI